MQQLIPQTLPIPWQALGYAAGVQKERETARPPPQD